MVAKDLLVAVAIILVAQSGVSTAKEFMVGDENGWRTGFDYQAWAKGKDFQVGDTLVFNYTKGDHNVVRVLGPDFLSCHVPSNAEIFNSGIDIITLKTPGKKWYICGVPSHCDDGKQKLAIQVGDSRATAPAPDIPWVQHQNSANAVIAIGGYTLVALVSIVMMVLI